MSTIKRLEFSVKVVRHIGKIKLWKSFARGSAELRQADSRAWLSPHEHEGELSHMDIATGTVPGRTVETIAARMQPFNRASGTEFLLHRAHPPVKLAGYYQPSLTGLI